MKFQIILSAPPDPLAAKGALLLRVGGRKGRGREGRRGKGGGGGGGEGREREGRGGEGREVKGEPTLRKKPGYGLMCINNNTPTDASIQGLQ